MKYFLLPLLVLIFSCSDKESCTNYSLITESNEKEASFKCDGLANSYPNFDVLSSVSIGCLTKDELEEAKKSESTVTMNKCSGVTFTVRTKIQ